MNSSPLALSHSLCVYNLNLRTPSIHASFCFVHFFKKLLRSDMYFDFLPVQSEGVIDVSVCLPVQSRVVISRCMCPPCTLINSQRCICPSNGTVGSGHGCICPSVYSVVLYKTFHFAAYWVCCVVNSVRLAYACSPQPLYCPLLTFCGMSFWVHQKC